MVDDYLSEREQADTLRRWFRENWLWLASAVVLGLAIVFGRQFYDDWRVRQGLTAGALYEQMVEALVRNDRPLALKLAGQIETDHARTPYADQAGLLAARARIDAGEFEQGAKLLEKLASGARDEDLRVIARLRLARVQIQQGNLDQAGKTLDAVDKTGIDTRVLDLRGDWLLARKDRAGALKAYREALALAEAKPELALVDTSLLQLKIDDLADVKAAK